MRGIDSETAPLLWGEGSRMDKRGGENQQGNGEFPGWRKGMDNYPTNPAAGCLLGPWRFPRPCFPTPSIYHSTARKRPAGASWSFGLWPLVPTACMVCWEINKHTNTKGKFCEVPAELTLSGQADFCNECV